MRRSVEPSERNVSIDNIARIAFSMAGAYATSRPYRAIRHRGRTFWRFALKAAIRFGSPLGPSQGRTAFQKCSEIAGNRLEFAKNHRRRAPLIVRSGIEAMVDVIVNKPPLRLADGLLDGIQLLRQLEATPTFVEHRDYSTKMTLRPLKAFDNIRVRLMHMGF
jgi:hypothetical protein